MISLLTGTLVHKSPTELVVDVNGVGYSVHIPLSTYEQMEHVGGAVKLFTHMHVREDAIQLFGFATEHEREFFRLLISVNGIGPKMAQGVLSGLSTAELREAILRGNITLLTSIPGVGRKTAERIVIELRDKLGREATAAPELPSTAKQMKIRAEAAVALMALGYSRASAEKALLAVIRESAGKEHSTEELIRLALRHTNA